MAMRPGPQTPPIYNGFAEMAVPWSGGSAVQGWRMGFPRLCFAGDWMLAGSRLFFALGVLGGAGACGVPLRASTPSRDWGFRAPGVMGGRGGRGPHV